MLDRERPDFVDIVTRPDSHLAIARLAANAGVHVICQKPMAPTMADAAAMISACADRGVRLLIHENWRWQPWYREIRRLVDAGVFGRIFHLGFRMRTGDGRGADAYPAQPYFREMPRLLIYETLVHFLDTFRYLAGEIDRVWCRTSRINPLIKGEDCAWIDLQFSGGCHGLIDANRISGPAPPETAFGTLTLEGERAALRMTPEGRLWLTEYGSDERQHEFTIPACGYKGDSVKAVQQHFVHCLNTGLPAESEGRDYLQTLAAVFACYESAAAGKPILPAQIAEGAL
jgi:predicted dehydrogenase